MPTTKKVSKKATPLTLTEKKLKRSADNYLKNWIAEAEKTELLTISLEESADEITELQLQVSALGKALHTKNNEVLDLGGICEVLLSEQRSLTHAYATVKENFEFHRKVTKAYTEGLEKSARAYYDTPIWTMIADRLKGRDKVA